MENFNRDNTDIFSVEVDDYAKITFLEMARWTKFLSILGFICLGLMVIGGVAFGMMISSSPVFASQLGPLGSIGAAGIIILYLLIASLMFYPHYAMLKYAIGIKIALSTNNKTKFNEAIAYLKNMFKYSGIMTIIFLCLYGVLMIFGVMGALGR
ncbi:MAG: hypothetical protein ACHQD8_03145 [Chitinophagales bacterium]